MIFLQKIDIESQAYQDHLGQAANQLSKEDCPKELSENIENIISNLIHETKNIQDTSKELQDELSEAKEELEEIISRDVAISYKLMRIIKSSFYHTC